MFPLMDERTPTKTVLARNLRHLMRSRKWNQAELSKRSKVSQRTISNILTNEKVPTLDTVDKIASAFGLNLWHLIMPKLIEDLESDTSIRLVYEQFFQANDQGKHFILSVAEREADYNKAS